MARLRVRARRNARLQYGPQRRELRRQKREARQTYRTGARQERQAARGIIGAAEQALRGIGRDYREAGAETRLANRLGGAVGDNLFAQADALSRRLTSRGIAQAKAGEKADLRSRQVRAQEAAAYGTRSLRAQMEQAIAEVAQERGEVAREEGQFALSELDRLRGERADTQRQAATDARADARLRLSLGRDAAQRRNRTGPYAKPGKDGRRAETVHSQNLKQQIIDARAEYERQINKGVPLKKIARSARQAGVSDLILNAASSLATRGYIPGNGVRVLRQVGVRVPKAWMGPPRKPRGGLNAVQGIGG